MPKADSRCCRQKPTQDWKAITLQLEINKLWFRDRTSEARFLPDSRDGEDRNNRSGTETPAGGSARSSGLDSQHPFSEPSRDRGWKRSRPSDGGKGGNGDDSCSPFPGGSLTGRRGQGLTWTRNEPNRGG